MTIKQSGWFSSGTRCISNFLIWKYENSHQHILLSIYMNFRSVASSYCAQRHTHMDRTKNHILLCCFAGEHGKTFTSINIMHRRFCKNSLWSTCYFHIHWQRDSLCQVITIPVISDTYRFTALLEMV